MYASVWVKLDKVELLTTDSFVDRLKHGSGRVRLLAKWRVSVAGMAMRVASCMGVDATIILCMSLRAPITYKRRELYIDAKVGAVWFLGGAMSCRVCPPPCCTRTHARTHAHTRCIAH
jgi:hypothetical protein